MVRRDLAQLRIRGIRADPIEEHADLELPFLQICPQQRGFLIVSELDRTELLGTPADAKPPLPAGAKVLDPLGMPTWRHQIFAVLISQQVDRGLSPLPGRAAFDLQNAGSVHAETRPCGYGDDPVEHVRREPARTLVVLWHARHCAIRDRGQVLTLAIWQAPRVAIIDVLMFDGCEALDALGPYEVLAYGGLDVRSVTRDDARLVRTSQGLELQASPPRGGAEWLIVPGGGWDARHLDPRAEAASGAVGAFACAHHQRGGKLAAVCTGTMWLADAGLIGARPATTHHQYWDELAATGADVRRGERVVDDGDLITSGGITSGMFLGLHLVERLLGTDARHRVEAEIELPNIPGTAPRVSA